ncbi:uncharacterized protein LOC127745449 [Arachis duranensis]|uniref:Uncharacterized protein LOC127745449 n=1 Tax=Arachis duranensis TaxID=130453 RepID=A0A9C6WR67_ARADU|nr:uncharacterized protein LOC127745449 [Arachis duranensis]
MGEDLMQIVCGIVSLGGLSSMYSGYPGRSALVMQTKDVSNKLHMQTLKRSPEYSLYGKVSSKSDGDGSNVLWGVNDNDIPNLTAPDSDEDELGGQLTAPMRKNRRLFDTPRGTASAPAKRSRGASCSKVTRKSIKTNFKPHHDMDLNWADTVLFKFLFSDGHPLEFNLSCLAVRLMAGLLKWL